MSILKAACVQMTSGPNIDENLEAAAGFIREAAAAGAQLIVTPETTCHIRSPLMSWLAATPPQDQHQGIAFFADLAKELNVWLLIGSLLIKRAERSVWNRSFLFSNAGHIAATYDKIHMYDAEPKPGEAYKESAIMNAGERAVVAHTPLAKIGMSICYDVRFGHLYRDMAKAGAQIMSVPAAFSMPTGEAHWESLLRARAIEAGSFILAAGQTGEHDGGRKTWGHSMIISPWGEILAEMDEKPGIIIADLNLDDVEKVRNAIPSLQHDRDYRLTHEQENI